jgi:hypothetical protein
MPSLPNPEKVVVYAKYDYYSSDIRLVVHLALPVRTIRGSCLELFAIDLENQWLQRFLTLLSS